MSGSGVINGPKRKRDTLGGAPNKKAIMSAMHSMKSLNLPPSEALQSGTSYPRKNIKSNNRREWMKECLKLLESMMIEDDSIPFREPVDCLKYPDFYTLVGDPIDLSKIMLKFRGGQYQDPFDFEKDVQQLFQDYKSFFTDADSEIFKNTQNLSSWFDQEFRRILDKYGDKLKRKFEVSSTSMSSSQLNTIASKKSHQDQAICPSVQLGASAFLPVKGESVDNAYRSISPQNGGLFHQQVMTSSPDRTPPQRWALQEQQMPMIHENLAKSCDSSITNSAYALTAEIGTKLALSHSKTDNVPMNCRIKDIKQCKESFPDYFSSQYQSDNLLINTPERYSRNTFTERSFSQHSDPGTFLRRDRSLDTLHSPNSSTFYSSNSPLIYSQQDVHRTRLMARSSEDLMGSDQENAQYKMEATDIQMKRDAQGSSTLLGIKLDVHSIYFGKVKCRPVQPVIMHENGFKMVVMSSDRDGEVTFNIKVEEIIRCAANLNRNKKHTLFVFVTPSVVERLEAQFALAESKSYLIILFMPAMSTTQIGQLLHVFHKMEKHSFFSNVFNEIDQSAVISLLANIKPYILEKKSRKGQRKAFVRCSSTSSSPAPGPAESSDQGAALDLSVSYVRGDLSVALNRVTVNEVDSSTNEQFNTNPYLSSNTESNASSSSSLLQVVPSVTCRTYKPKFHFRSHSSQGTLTKQGSANSEPGSLFQGYTGSRSLDIEIGAPSSPNCNSVTGKSAISECSSNNSVYSKEQDMDDDSRYSHDERERRLKNISRQSSQKGSMEIDSDFEFELESDKEEVSPSHNNIIILNEYSPHEDPTTNTGGSYR